MKKEKDEKKKGLFKSKLAKGILAGVLGFTLIGTVVGVTENQYHWISNNVSKKIMKTTLRWIRQSKKRME